MATDNTDNTYDAFAEYRPLPLPTSALPNTPVNSPVQTLPSGYTSGQVNPNYSSLYQTLAPQGTENYFSTPPPAQPSVFKDYVVPGMEAFTGVGNLYLGNQALNLAEDQFKLSRDQWNRNWGAQADVYNTNLTQQQRNRMSGMGIYEDNPDLFEQDLATYVANNKIDTAGV